MTAIDLVPDDEPATGQMQEFAQRTHQDGIPRLARDFEPPAIDLAATPVRVEQWRTASPANGSGVIYRVIGIRWGGGAAGARAGLTIRFRAGAPFVPVDQSSRAIEGTSWSLWSHLWRPDAPGVYQIVLGTTDPALRTRRLDLRYYTRDVQIDEI